jgi:competence protein ComEC
LYRYITNIYDWSQFKEFNGRMKTHWKYFLTVLLLVTATMWMAVFFYPAANLRIIACDVGQGDAILIIHGKKQILIDGGPNNKVVDCLDRYLPFWDRQLELVILTHPERDHFFGLIEVMQRFDVQVLLATGIDNSSIEYQVLKTTVGGRGVKVVDPRSGMKLRLGMIYLDIFHPPDTYFSGLKDTTNSYPDGQVLGVYTSTRDLNDFSIVNLLTYGNFRALMTGDILPDSIDVLLQNYEMSDVNYIKVPHHGSKNGLTQSLLDAVKPEVAVISVGKNSYGHPHKEVLEMLAGYELKVLRTDEMGDVVVVTDGEKIWIKD